VRVSWLLALLACSVLAVATVQAATQTCLDENGDAVDWFVIVKLPRLVDSDIPGVAKGTSYLYGDANSYSNPDMFWSNSSNQITDAESSAGMTIQQIYDGSNSESNGWLMYNDETPSGTTSMSYGHTKGMLSWNKDGGFWLIHSVPKYSESPDNGASSYAYPSSGEMYGQSFLCITMDVENIDKAFLQMEYTNPQVYGSQWVSALTSKMPHGNDFMNNNVVVKSASPRSPTLPVLVESPSRTLPRLSLGDRASTVHSLDHSMMRTWLLRLGSDLTSSLSSPLLYLMLSIPFWLCPLLTTLSIRPLGRNHRIMPSGVFQLTVTLL